MKFSLAGVCSSWRAIARTLFFDQPWQNPQSGESLITLPEHMLMMPPPRAISPDFILRCHVCQRSKSHFDLWMDRPSASGQPRFLLSARKIGFSSFSISLRRPATQPNATARSLPVRCLAVKNLHSPDAPDSHMEVAQLLGNTLRTSYELLTVDKLWIRRAMEGAIGFPQNHITSRGAPAPGSMVAKVSPSITAPSSLIGQPFLKAEYTIRNNGLLIPRR